ncbi:MAG: hypothetical protein Q9208_000945 [Pyrenodesmia sp. 3 TL-2023]
MSNNHLAIAELLASRKDFDPDVQDGSGWTPLMIASSLKEGDALVDLLLAKEADVNMKTVSEGHGDTALALLKAGAETDKQDMDGHLALDLAPDAKVWLPQRMRLTEDRINRR